MQLSNYVAKTMNIEKEQAGQAHFWAAIYVAAVAATLCESMGITPMQLSMATIRGLYALETGLGVGFAARMGWRMMRKSAAIRGQERIMRGDFGD